MCDVYSTRKQPLAATSEPAKDNPLTSIFHLASIVDTLRQQGDVVPDFQRVTITGEETSGVSFENYSLFANKCW